MLSPSISYDVSYSAARTYNGLPTLQISITSASPTPVSNSEEIFTYLVLKRRDTGAPGGSNSDSFMMDFINRGLYCGSEEARSDHILLRTKLKLSG